MRLPGFAYITRREPFAGPQFHGENVNRILPEKHTIDNLPDPIRQGEFWANGKPASLQWASMPIAMHWNLAGILGVMEDTFKMNKVTGQLSSFAPRGGQNPWGQRANIGRPTSAPYGDQTMVPGIATNPGNVTVNGLSYDF